MSQIVAQCLSRCVEAFIFESGFGSADPIDPTHPAAAVEVGAFADFFGQILRVLDGFAVHVADVERTVRTVREEYGAKPIIAARQKFAAFRRGARGKSRADRS